MLLDEKFSYEKLRAMNQSELPQLAEEVRQMIIDVSLENGGHMASSLGCVELCISLLRQFNLHSDKLIYDVGHQSYAHKILTDRLARFHTIRKEGGISGFPKRTESPFDHFDTGHSSTSISAALGYAKARDLLRQDHHVAALIGDASLINGLAFEALNHVREANTRVIIILNDNTQSIDKRVGGISNSIARLSSNPSYNKLKQSIKNICASLPGGKTVEKRLERFRDHIKHVMKPENIFDDLDINYWGPFDGHHIQSIEAILGLAKTYDRPVLLHFITQKGKGYPEAETNPVYYHGVPSNGSKGKKCKTWSMAATERVGELAEMDSRVVCLTAAMATGTKLDEFARNNPERFFDVGIAESHMLTLAAGMAAGGLRPWVFIYSTFLQRAIDQLVHDIALQNLPVVIMVDRAGMTGDDGETHQGLFDISWCKPIPNIEIFTPRDEVDLEMAIEHASKRDAPTIIRYPRGCAPKSIARGESPEIIRAQIIFGSDDWSVISYGSTVELALKTRELCETEGMEKIPGVVDLRIIKPIDFETIDKVLRSNSLAVVVEDCYTAGGIGEQIAARALEIKSDCRVRIIGAPMKFVEHASVSRQWELCGLTARNIADCYKIN